MEPEIVCIYHKSDLDGVCSAAIVKHFHPDAELFGMDYGDEFPWDKVAGKQVIMVDFSLKPDDMKRLTATREFVWIDHHKSAIDSAIEGNYSTTRGGCAGVQTPSYAACELCWKYFKAMGAYDEFAKSPKEWCELLITHPVPPAVSLLGRYDAWKKDDPEWESKILPFQYGCRGCHDIYNPDGEWWPTLLDTGYTGLPLINRGAFVLNYLSTERQEQMKRCGFECALEGLRAICCNTASPGSGTFDGVYDPEKHDVMVCFMQKSDGRWRHGIYTTKDDIDCSAIAKKFGGGGHRKAAGCETTAPIVSPV